MARTDMGSQSGFTRQKSEGFSGGFTIIEVILFLAISGMLLGAAIASVTANINNSRFNDAIRSTTSYLQEQYNAVASGESDRDESRGCDETTGIITPVPTTPGMTKCVIMGRFIKLEGSTLTVRYITGNRNTLVGISDDDTDAVLEMHPKVAGTTTYDGSYQVPWRIGVVNTTLMPGSIKSPSTGFAIIRSPASGNILYYTVKDITSAEPLLDPSFIKTGNLNRESTVCFTDGSSRVGRINIAKGQGQEIIKTDLANKEACP